jgi:hypothetical protein
MREVLIIAALADRGVCCRLLELDALQPIEDRQRKPVRQPLSAIGDVFCRELAILEHDAPAEQHQYAARQTDCEHEGQKLPAR